MTDDEFNKIKGIVEKEIKLYEDKMLRKDSQYLFKNAREIYATRFIGDCLTDEDFMTELNFNIFNNKKLLESITNCYLESHGEICESDIRDMLIFYEKDVRDFYKKTNESEM